MTGQILSFSVLLQMVARIVTGSRQWTYLDLEGAHSCHVEATGSFKTLLQQSDATARKPSTSISSHISVQG
jgi:hypothetical protein